MARSLRQHCAKTARQTVQLGVTLIELLVALALTGVVTIACIALYTSSVQSYRTVDGNQELQMKARFAFEIMGQAARNAGFQDRVGRLGSIDDKEAASIVGSVFKPAGAVFAVKGFDNSKVTGGQVADKFFDGANGSGGHNSSDSMVIRYFGSGIRSNGGTADGSMVDCKGTAHGYPFSNTAADIPVSMFYVELNQNEPELYCVSIELPSGSRTRIPLIQGVETIQFMYGVDVGNTETKYPTRWMTASDITDSQWPLVRWIRVGMVIRGSPGSAASEEAETLYPLGKEFIGSTPTPGHVFVAPADGRLRRTYSTVLQIRSTVQ